MKPMTSLSETPVGGLAAPTPLAELMALDPLLLTKDDPRLTPVIEEFRRMRSQYGDGDRKAGSTKEKKAKAPTKKLDLSELGL